MILGILLQLKTYQKLSISWLNRNPSLGHTSVRQKCIFTRGGCDWLNGWYFIVLVRSGCSTLEAKCRRRPHLRRHGSCRRYRRHQPSQRPLRSPPPPPPPPPARSGRGDFSIGGDVVARTVDDTTSQTAGRRTM